MSTKKNFARFGMAAKGAVYSLIGILTAIAALNGGSSTGSTGALEYVSNMSFGKILLFILALGLIGYVFWRMYQTFANPGGLESDFKGIAKRVAYFISGVFYGFLAYYAITLALGESSGGGNSNMGSDYGSTIAIIVGIGIIIKAVYDLYRAYSGKFREEVEEAEMSNKEQKVLINAGKFGHTARGIVLALMAYLTLKSGIDGASISTKTDAFSYIQSEYGATVLVVIAVGLLCYGVYMFIKAKYPSVTVS